MEFQQVAVVELLAVVVQQLDLEEGIFLKVEMVVQVQQQKLMDRL